LGSLLQREEKEAIHPLPWKIGEIIVKHISHLDELAGHLDQLGLKEVELVEGFDPNDMFTAHMASIGYSSYFTKIEQFKEGGGDNLNLPEFQSTKILMTWRN
jgi:hypothetical protein